MVNWHWYFFFFCQNMHYTGLNLDGDISIILTQIITLRIYILMDVYHLCISPLINYFEKIKYMRVEFGW